VLETLLQELVILMCAKYANLVITLPPCARMLETWNLNVLNVVYHIRRRIVGLNVDIVMVWDIWGQMLEVGKGWEDNINLK